MSTWETCPQCAGSGQIEKPTVVEKIARHLIYAAANKARGPFGLGLAPDEVDELGRALGILPAEAPAELGSMAAAEAGSAAASPAVDDAAAAAPAPVVDGAEAAWDAWHAEQLARQEAHAAELAAAAGAPERPAEAPPAPELPVPPAPGITVNAASWEPVAGMPLPGPDPAPAIPPADPAPPASLTGPPGGR